MRSVGGEDRGLAVLVESEDLIVLGARSIHPRRSGGHARNGDPGDGRLLGGIIVGTPANSCGRQSECAEGGNQCNQLRGGFHSGIELSVRSICFLCRVSCWPRKISH